MGPAARGQRLAERHHPGVGGGVARQTEAGDGRREDEARGGRHGAAARNVGTTCIPRAFRRSAAFRELLTACACALGGERVAPIGLCSNGQLNAIAFGVYVPR